MRVPGFLSVVVLLAGPLAGQQWSAGEAAAAGLLRWVSARPQVLLQTAATGEVFSSNVLPLVNLASRKQVVVGGYRFELHNEKSGGPKDGWILYAWPEEHTAECQEQVFAATAQGIVFSDNRVQLYEGAAAVPEWFAACGSGGEQDLAAVLLTPGKGQDRGMWQPLSMVQTQVQRIRVVDESGEPLAHARVFVGPRTWFGQRAPAAPQVETTPGMALPCGLAATDANGEGQLLGFVSDDAEVRIGIYSVMVGLAEPPRRVGDAGVELVLDGNALRALNESTAVAVLKSVCSAQAQFRASAAIDTDKNGVAEYGFLAELAGGVALRRDQYGQLGTEKLGPPVLSQGLAQVNEGCVERNGYLFQVFLPGNDGSWLAENTTGGGAGLAVAAKRAESEWCLYGWPLAGDRSGRRVFFINQSGDVLAAENADGRYAGLAKRPAPGAAFVAGQQGAVAANAVGNDGQRWIVIN